VLFVRAVSPSSFDEDGSLRADRIGERAAKAAVTIAL
jgi:hypothetical protein